MSTVNTLTRYMKENGISQEAIGRIIGKSTAVVNQYLSGKYKGNVAAIDIAINDFLNTVKEKQQVTTNTDFIETSTSLKMLEVIKSSHVDGDINVIYGQAGLGKTMSLRNYHRHHSDSIMVETDPGYTARALLEVICDSLGLNAVGSIHALSTSIVKRLRDSSYVLLIDEAENLPLRALEAIRRIHDKTGVGVVLAGMPKLLVNLKGRRGELAQLYSRVGFALNLGNELPADDMLDMITSMTPTKDTKVATEILNASKGNARRLSKLIRRVNRVSQINNMEATTAIVRDCAKILID